MQDRDLLLPALPPYDDVIGSGATPTATEGRKETTDLIQDTPEEDQQTGHMDTQNSNDEDDNNQSIVNDAEDSASNRDCTRGHTEDKEQEEDTTLRQEPGSPSRQDTYTTRTTSEDTVATERNQASNEQLEATEREVDQGHQPGAESDSKTNGSHGQSQEADVEAIPSPVAQERVSQPASTARTLRSGRDTQKGRSQSQSSIVDSFRRCSPATEPRTTRQEEGALRTGLQVPPTDRTSAGPQVKIKTLINEIRGLKCSQVRGISVSPRSVLVKWKKV